MTPVSDPSSTSKLAVVTGHGLGVTPSHGGYGSGHNCLPNGWRIGTQSKPVEAGATPPVGGGVREGAVSLSELMRMSQAETALDKREAKSEPMQAPSLSELAEVRGPTRSQAPPPSQERMTKAEILAPSLFELMAAAEEGGGRKGDSIVVGVSSSSSSARSHLITLSDLMKKHSAEQHLEGKRGGSRVPQQRHYSPSLSQLIEKGDGLAGHLQCTGEAQMNLSSASTMMEQAPATTGPSSSPSLSELMKDAPATGPSNSPSLSELMKDTPSATVPSSSPSLSELMKHTTSATGPSSPSLSELMKDSPATVPSSSPSLSELMKDTPSATVPSGSPSLSELMKDTPSATGPSSSLSLSELMKDTPSATGPSSSPSLSELMKDTPSATGPSSSPSLSGLMKDIPSATGPSSSPSLSELMKQASSGTVSKHVELPGTRVHSTAGASVSLEALTRQPPVATKRESETPQEVHRRGTEASSSSLLLMAAQGHTQPPPAAEAGGTLTLADWMKQLDTDTKPCDVTTPSQHARKHSSESRGDSLLVTASHYDHYPMGDVTVGDFPYSPMSYSSGWSSSGRGLASSSTSLQQYGGSLGFPTSNTMSHGSHMLLSRGGRVEHAEDQTLRAVTMDTVFRSVATAISSTSKRENDSTGSGLTSVPAIVSPAEASPCAIVVSKRYSRCVNYEHVEADILKSFVSDWTGGKTQCFSFSTPSPDDVILANRKGFIRQS